MNKLFIITLFSFIFTFSSAYSNTIIVNKDNSNYTTITDAVNNSKSGDIIIVEPGEYKEFITVNSNNLTIKSRKRHQAFCYGFNINNVSNVIIDGFKISGILNPNRQIHGVIIKGNTITIKRNYFDYISGYCVYTNYDNYELSNNIQIVDNHAYNVSNGYFLFGNNCVIKENEIEKLNLWYKLLNYGYNSNNFVNIIGNKNRISDNLFYKSDIKNVSNSTGILVNSIEKYTSNDINIENNVILDTHYGITFGGQTLSTVNAVIQNNILCNFDKCIIYAKDIQNILIKDNILINSKNKGVYLTTNSYGTITNNILYNINNVLPYVGNRAIGYNNILFSTKISYSKTYFPDDIININPLLIDLRSYDNDILKHFLSLIETGYVKMLSDYSIEEFNPSSKPVEEDIENEIDLINSIDVNVKDENTKIDKKNITTFDKKTWYYDIYVNWLEHHQSLKN